MALDLMTINLSNDRILLLIPRVLEIGDDPEICEIEIQILFLEVLMMNLCSDPIPILIPKVLEIGDDLEVYEIEVQIQILGVVTAVLRSDPILMLIPSDRNFFYYKYFYSIQFKLYDITPNTEVLCPIR